MGASGSAGGLAPAGVRSTPPRRIFRGWPEGAVRGGLAATPARNESSRPAVASRAEGARPRGHPLLDRALVLLSGAHHGAVGPVLRRGSVSHTAALDTISLLAESIWEDEGSFGHSSATNG